MRGEVIYVNDKYPAEQIMWFIEKGIQRPIEGQIYTVRELVKPSAKAGMGVLLNEIVNPKVMLYHPIMGTDVAIEVSWNLNRFRTLTGEVLTKEMLESKTEKV